MSYGRTAGGSEGRSCPLEGDDGGGGNWTGGVGSDGSWPVEGGGGTWAGTGGGAGGIDDEPREVLELPGLFPPTTELGEMPEPEGFDDDAAGAEEPGELADGAPDVLLELLEGRPVLTTETAP